MANALTEGDGSVSHEQIYAELTDVRRESSETRRLLADHARKAAAARSATNKRFERGDAGHLLNPRQRLAEILSRRHRARGVLRDE